MYLSFFLVLIAWNPRWRSGKKAASLLKTVFQSPAEFQRVLRLVPPERREKVMKFINESDRHMHLCGRLLLRFMIHKHTGIPYPDIAFAYTKGNKPVLKTPLPPGCDMPNYNFNYSHDGELVCAGSEPEVIIGGLQKQKRNQYFLTLFVSQWMWRVLTCARTRAQRSGSTTCGVALLRQSGRRFGEARATERSCFASLSFGL